MKPDARLLLQVADHAEEIARLRITARAKHADQALRRGIRRLAELFEADCRIDGVAQDRLAGVEIAGQRCIDPLTQKRTPKRGSSATRLCTSSRKLFVSAL